MAQCGIVDTAAVEALNGDVTAQVLVDMLVERGLLQHSEEGECFVTGELVVYTNGILNLLGYSPDAFVDAASITNSWMHLVISCPVLVRLGVEIELELELDIGSTPSTRDDGLDHAIDAAATLCSTQRKMILKIICSSCMFGRIGQEVTGDTPELCAAYVAAADEIRSTARSLAAAIKAKDLRSVNRLVPKLKEMMHALVPALVRAYPKEALEKTWSKIQDALYRQRDVDTPAFLRELKKCPKPVHVAVPLRPGSFKPSQPLPMPKVVIVRDVKKVDLELSKSKVFESVGSKAAALGAAVTAEGFGDVNTLPGHETPLSVLSQTRNVLRSDQASCNSLMFSRSGMMAAIDPKTHEILFRTDRLDSGHPSIDAAYIQRHAIDAVTSGAYRDLRQLANADRDALLRAAAEEDNKRTAHVDEVAFRLHEAYASGTIPNVVAFLAQARYADRDGRAFADRDALEKRLASIGVPCLPLLEGEGGISSNTSISDVDRYLYRVLPPHLRVCRRRVVVVFPERHVYPEDPEGMGHNLAEHLARKCRVFSETVARAAFDDVTVLDDLDSHLLVPHKPFVPVDKIFLENHRIARANPLATTMPKVMFNAAAGFKSKADVAREAAEKRKAELANVVAPGQLRLKTKTR